MIHSRIGMPPVEAREKKNRLQVRRDLELHANNTRKYQDINVSVKVKIYRKVEFKNISDSN